MIKNKLIRMIFNLYPLKRGKRFLNPLYKYISGYSIIDDINGNKMLLNLDNYIDSIIYLNGSYEDNCIKTLHQKYLENNCSYFIDIGANIGIYSIYFSKDKNLERCFAFEPEPNNFAQLNANIFLNQTARKTKLFNCALSNENTKGEFYISNKKKDVDLGKINTGMHSLDKNDDKYREKIEVEIFKGDDLVDIKNESICLKIDVEGHELNVLKGFYNLFNHNKCLIMIEIFEDKFSETHNYLIKNNFQKITIHSNLGANYLYKNF